MRSWRLRSFRLRTLFAVVTLAALAVWYWSGYMPGTLQIQVEGRRFQAWGTGVQTQRYPTGAVRSRHWFLAGRHIRSCWYKPDGTLFHESLVEPETPAKFYELRDDGTVSDEFFLLNGIPEGRWVHYDPAGKVVRVDTLVDGIVLDQLP